MNRRYTAPPAMERPSHWILASSPLLIGAYLLFAPRADRDLPATPGPVAPVVVPDVGQTRDTLRGRVVDELGWPVAHAQVELVGSDVHVTADDDGVFSVEVPPLRPQQVRITAASHEVTVREGQAGEDMVVVLRDALPWPVEVTAPRSASESHLLAGEGFLRDPEGKGVGNAVIAVVETGARTVTDATGRFRIALPGEGPATLVAYDGAGHAGRSEPYTSVRKQGLVPLPDLVLGDGVALRGQLRDPADVVCAGGAVRLRGYGIDRVVRTDRQGVFSFDGLLSGRYVVEALPHRGSLGTERELDVAGDTDVDLRLTAPRPLRLTVVAAASPEQPVRGVHVVAEEGSLRRAVATTGPEGSATLADVGPGPFAWEVRAAENNRPNEVVDFAEGAEGDEVALLRVRPQ